MREMQSGEQRHTLVQLPLLPSGTGQSGDVRVVSFVNSKTGAGAPATSLSGNAAATDAAAAPAGRSRVIARIPTRVELKTLTHLAKRPAISIDFKDIEYSVSNPLGTKHDRTKTILHQVSGSFRSGELTAIMGSSGAGKSTLMNILAGYVTIGVTGTVETNGHPRQLSHFNKLTSYIMQDDMLQPFLTVEESMIFAANLKLGNELSDQDKIHVVDEILKTLGIDKARDTRTERLSGGQRKRLAVGLELVNNPPVIFLDEPTTGLDTVSTTQLISMVQLLARQGRTIICTIHQPTATVFQSFDLVYVMAAGRCMYQGSSQQLTPFLEQCNLRCPTTYNPADYVMEVISEGHQNARLCAEVKNGKLRIEQEKNDAKPGERKSAATKLCRKETLAVMPKVYSEDVDESANNSMQFPTTFIQQFRILLKRKLIQQRRNKITLMIMLSHHLLSGLIIGTIFVGCGNDANRPFDNVRLIMACVVFYMYTHIMCNVLLFPFEVKRLRREYFNRWYGLKSYFLSHSLSSLPDHILYGLIFTIIIYFLTNQPLDTTRLVWFYVFGLLLGLTSEGLGITLGAIFKTQNGSIAGPMTIVPMLAVAVYGMGFGRSIEPSMQILMYMSYLRFGIVGYNTAVYTEREPMHCDEPYCHYQHPDKLLRDLGMLGQQPHTQAIFLCAFIIFFRVTAYLALRYKLSLQFSTHIYTYILKILKRLGK